MNDDTLTDEQLASIRDTERRSSVTAIGFQRDANGRKWVVFRPGGLWDMEWTRMESRLLQEVVNDKAIPADGANHG